LADYHLTKEHGYSLYAWNPRRNSGLFSFRNRSIFGLWWVLAFFLQGIYSGTLPAGGTLNPPMMRNKDQYDMLTKVQLCIIVSAPIIIGILVVAAFMAK
jgi:hypothetical protein